ncbi:DUF4242 domain-containing protein [Sabulilitoribacter arenilitoris]|uniref:DUF4242 domain-containing protein n=1 Tax=Wocania arenilitoris TaxID=2044858 RepID=A0AAE3EN41_9FLAO|nr:nickel-binding protein [Wocania arenilitoris]MCF7568468.1 DUF4242 domain-containing protein [Wocania arenilitoris]
MDIHTVDSDEFSAEDVVKAHMEDLAIQDQFGVKQLKYWVNEQAKTIFCLMEGPDKDACNQVHLQSHGNTACNIIEVADNEYNLFMGQGTDVDDLAKTDSGELDPGYRTILLTNIVSFTKKEQDHLKRIMEVIKEHNGIIVREPDHQTMATFMYANDAISCATSIKNLLDKASDNLEFNLAVVSGKPVDEEGETFFEETKLRVNGLCALGLNSQLYLDKETIVLSDKEMSDQKEKQNNFTILDSDDLLFSMNLSKIVSDNFTRSDFTTEDLFNALGLSKSQASRKIKSLTNMAPNQLIQESRLLRAVSTMIKANKTIAEIGYESGFNSPTYFTRVFKKRFGVSPTDFSKQLA